MIKFFKTIGILKKLRKIEPDARWLKILRLNFARQNPVSLLARRRFLKTKLAPALISFILVLFIGGSMVGYAQAAMPTDSLYLLKLFSERVQGFFVIGNKNKADFALTLAEKRLKEAEQQAQVRVASASSTITTTSPLAIDNDDVAIKDTVFRAQYHLGQAEALLKKILHADAKQIQHMEQLGKTLKNLERIADQRNQLVQRLSDKFPAVAEALEDVEIASVNVEQTINKITLTFELYDISEHNTTSTSTTTPIRNLTDVLRLQAEKAIARAEHKISVIEAQLATSTTSTATSLEEAQEELAEAKEKLSEGKFAEAIEKANEAFKEAVKINTSTTQFSPPKTNHGTQQIIHLLTEGAGKSGKVPPGLLHAPGIQKKLERAGYNDEGEDKTSPVISQVNVSGITFATATVTWATNEPATSRVDYGTSTSYTASIGYHTATTSHSITIGGLSSQTLYHFRVRSKDASGNEAFSNDSTFTTLTALDTAAPVISALQASEITTSSAKISWATNEFSDSLVNFGISTSYGQIASSSNLVTSHIITLTDLAASTTVHFQAQSKDASGNIATSSDQTFITLLLLDTTPPVLSAVNVTNVSSTSATINWTTNELATSKVYYSLVSPLDIASTSTLSETNATLVNNHSMNLAALNASSTYYFIVQSSDATGNTATSSESSFTTLSE